MKKNIRPISALRDTTQLEEDLKQEGELIITKNGYANMVIVNPDIYGDKLSEPSEENINNSKKQCDPLGFVKVGAVTIDMKVGDPENNENEILKKLREAEKQNVKILAFQELTLTGYTCGDLFLSDFVISKAEECLIDLAKQSESIDVFFSVGVPLRKNGNLYNCAVAIYKGRILGLVPKVNIPTYTEFYELRHFSPAPEENSTIEIGGKSYPFGPSILFQNKRYKNMVIGLETCEDLWVPSSPSTSLCLAGATIILNGSASNEVVGKADYRRRLVSMGSAKNICAYLYADAGKGESTTDLVFAGHNIISENGKILAESPLFKDEIAVSEIDLELLMHERARTNTFSGGNPSEYLLVSFSQEVEVPDKLIRHYARNPFIPEQKEIDHDRVKAILEMQASGLANRLRAINCHKAVIGISGGLDSTLALLVAVTAFDDLGYDRKGILGVTMPAFGTSNRTHNNAVALCESLGVSLREINISETVTSHLKDIGVDLSSREIVYENAQARERTQVLFDVANKEGGIVIGTGDLSELCLGWCTYNGDHMSMYGVNASIPKTLVKYLCSGYAEMHPECAEAIMDIVETPISPELLPPKDGEIAQLTEDNIGPYELHDFFIYHYLRFGFAPKKLYYLAKIAYEGKYDASTIKKWLRVFFKRFYGNQFKRSCLPDGAKIGTVSISPRGDWRMPSDASSSAVIRQIDELPE